MPKYCTNCRVVRSRSAFYKGKTICKDCAAEETLSAASESTTFVDVPWKEVAAKVDSMEKTMREMVDSMQEVCNNVKELRERLERGEAIQRIALTTLGKE